MFREVPNNIKIIKLFTLLSFVVCWMSISTSFKDLLIFNESNDLNLKNIFNFLRHLSIYICFFFLILFFVAFNKKINFRKYIIFYIFIGYFVSQVYGLFVSGNEIENISFIISALTVIFTIILVDNFFTKREKNYFLIISFIILNIVFFLTFFPQLLKYLNGASIYGGFLTSDAFFGKNSPRSSGLARMALLILMFVELFEIYLIKKHTKKILFVKISFLTFIFLFQSRTIIFLTILNYLIIFINKNEVTFKNFLKFLSSYFLIPIILFYSLSSFNSYQRVDKSLNLYGDNSYIERYIEHLKSKELKIIRDMSEGDVSSGRFGDWNKIINKVSGKNIVYGFGAQGDRHIINQTASNGLLYAYSSSGIIGLLFFITFLIMVSFQTIKNFVFQFRKNITEIIHCLIIMILSLRAVLETSYAVFSVDLIVFILALSFIFDNNIKINDIKKKFLR
tara:strand:- start:1388 stop:2740 length:1353 start_codon:yes stop_codon:yes gene_type:complete